ncbi:MAG: ABC transporter ATP-binding protein [Magnetococcales bacterium]|nr:ABC transporter ATP-binding protein [Magnetococcales bacterium]
MSDSPEIKTPVKSTGGLVENSLDGLEKNPPASRSDTPLLRARGVTRTFFTQAQEVTVLQGIDVDLYRGEMAALLGISGSGKSTLIQILGGLDHPTSGRVELDGKALFDLSSPQRAALRNRRIGFIYQFHRLLPEFDALENVLMPLLIGRMDHKSAADQAKQALAEVGLDHRLHHKPGELSGGEQQRVAIARAIVTKPDLLLADEPTGNLDRQNALGVFDLLKRLNRERGLTCLIVTHNHELAGAIGRRVRISDGRLVEDVPVEMES